VRRRLGQAAVDARERDGLMSRYRFVEAEKGRYPVTRLCRMAQVSRATYYLWQEGRGSARQAAYTALTVAIHAIHVVLCQVREPVSSRGSG
jgi:hypothetical protein